MLKIKIKPSKFFQNVKNKIFDQSKLFIAQLPKTQALKTKVSFLNQTYCQEQEEEQQQRNGTFLTCTAAPERVEK